MPNSSRSFQNLAPFEPRFDNVKNHPLAEPTPLGTLDGSMYFEQTPPPPPGSPYEEGDIWVYQGEEFTITYRFDIIDGSPQWVELGRVPKGKPLKSILPFAFTIFREEKVGEATICGYSEFTDPSSPPKKYRRLDGETTGGGVLVDTTQDVVQTCSYVGVNDCSDPDCGSEMPEVEGETNIVGFGQEFGWRGSLTIGSETISSVTYVASCEAFYDPDGANDPRAARIMLSTEPPTYIGDGGTITLTKGTNLTASIQFQFLVGEWATAYGECLLVGYAVTALADLWTITGVYDENCKLTESREVYRFLGGGFCLNYSTDPSSNLSGADPQAQYGDICSVIATKTQKTFNISLPCEAGILEYPTSTFVSGVVTYTLSEEDTMDEAVARFAQNPYSGGKKWSGGWPEERAYSERQEQGESFSVDMVLSRVNINIGGLEPNASYQVTVDLFEGPYRSISQGDYSEAGVLSETVTATEGGQAGVTLEVPATEGMTTVAVIKSVVKN